MTSKEPQVKINQNGFQRRLSISLAGATGGLRLLSNRATSVLLPEEQKRQSHKYALAKEAKLFAEKLGELKGAYVKIGQMMALYGDHFLPKEITNALHDLEHKTSKLDWLIIEPVIKNSLDSKHKDLLVEKHAIAAASLAQVHRAKHKKNKKDLCIKVQYPGVANTINADFNVVLQMLKFGRWVQSGRDIEAWMLEIRTMLVDEVDYHRELIMTQEVAKLLSGDSRYLVPKIEKRYSGEHVLTMNYLDGFEVTHQTISKLSQKRRNSIAKAMLEIFFKEVFAWGIMQTDPNFGNYRIQLRSSHADKDKLILLDFGAVRELDKQFMQALRSTIVSAYINDTVGVIKSSIELGCLRESQPDSVKESFAVFCLLLMEPFRKDKSDIPRYALNNKNQYKWYESKLLKRVAKLGAKSLEIDGFSSPPKEFALIARKLTGVFTFVSTLKAEINSHSIIEQYLKT